MIAWLILFTLSFARAESLDVVDTPYVKTRPTLDWGRDPFLATPGYVSSPTIDPKYKLEAVIYSEDSPRALLNGQIVQPGDRIKGGAYVEQIGPTFVLLRVDDGLRQVTVIPKIDPVPALTTPDRSPASR